MYIFIKYKASLNRNTHKTRLFTKQLTKMCDQRLTETQPSISLRSNECLRIC